MAFEGQAQIALERLDESLSRLYNLIKRGQQTEALNYMTQGELKERFEELQNMVKISQTGNLGSRGTANGPGMF